MSNILLCHIKLCSQANISGSKKSINYFAKNSENMMCMGVADDMPTLDNEIYRELYLLIS